MVALGDAADRAPDRLDDARALVAENRRDRDVRPLTLDDVPVRMADAARYEPDPHMLRPEVGQLERLDPERRVGLVEHGTLHDGTSLLAARWLADRRRHAKRAWAANRAAIRSGARNQPADGRDQRSGGALSRSIAANTSRACLNAELAAGTPQ